jgi:arsenate reductase
MVEHPRLIERPVGFAGEKVALGRPTENFLELL